MKYVVLLVVGFLMGCGGEEPPSCQQAVEHYYGAGCGFYDLDTGDPIPANTIISVCRDIVSGSTTAACDSATEDFRFCLADVPDVAMVNADCDCSQSQERLLQVCQ